MTEKAIAKHAHGHRAGVPTGRNHPAPRARIDMKTLRIEFAGEFQNLRFCHAIGAEAPPGAGLQIFKRQTCHCVSRSTWVRSNQLPPTIARTRAMTSLGVAYSLSTAAAHSSPF